MNCKTCGIEIRPLAVSQYSEGVFADILKSAANAPRDCPACYQASRRKNWEDQCRAIWAESAPRSVQMPNDGRLAQLDNALKNFPSSLNGKRNFFLLGPCRTGKTFAAWQCLLSARIAGKSFDAVTGSDFGFALRDFSADIPAMIDRLTYPDILLIDDFGKTDWAARGVAALVFSVVNRRTEAQKTTVFTANASLANLRKACEAEAPTFSDPIFTRLEESLIVRILQ